MTATETSRTEAAAPFADNVPAGYQRDAKGRLVPENQIRDVDRLEDQLVRKLLGHAEDINRQIARFCTHCENDVDAFNQLISEKYGAKPRGGRKGGMQFSSFDGCLQVRFVAADVVDFGPGLQVAKSLIDECIAEWSEGSNPGIVTLVQRAFEVDKAGNISLEKIRAVRRVEIDDPRWLRAMKAIDDSERTIATKVYPTFRRRQSPEHKWRQITIDLASAVAAA